jgi:hypothetical protein
VGLEKAELVVQSMPTFAALNHPFELSEALKRNRKGEFDTPSMKVLNDGIVEKRGVDTRLYPVMTVYQAPLQMAKTSPQSLLEADQGEEVLKQDKARVRRQVLRFESNLQSGPGFTSNIRFAMFHVGGLRLDWYSVLVNVHCTHAEATVYIGGAFISSLTPRSWNFQTS